MNNCFNRLNEKFNSFCNLLTALGNCAFLPIKSEKYCFDFISITSKPRLSISQGWGSCWWSGGGYIIF